MWSSQKKKKTKTNPKSSWIEEKRKQRNRRNEHKMYFEVET